jgi:hypothetical protein
MSGVNRFAQRNEVLKRPKNRLVKAYMDIVEFYQPKALLMEQVRAAGTDATDATAAVQCSDGACVWCLGLKTVWSVGTCTTCGAC